jgi:FtsH-binding integral membrane protein
MGPLDLLIHVLNFVAPALWLATVLALVARVFIRKQPPARTLFGQAAINFIVSLAALLLGLWFFGHDGKMATYTAMALLCATSQWFLLRGWRA